MSYPPLGDYRGPSPCKCTDFDILGKLLECFAAAKVSFSPLQAGKKKSASPKTRNADISLSSMTSDK